jgi:hypothetical protein
MEGRRADAGRAGLPGGWAPGGGWGAGILVALVVLGLVAGLPPLARRMAAESASRSVQLAVDYPDYASLALRQGMEPAQLLARLRAAGATDAGVPEVTLESLRQSGEVTATTGAEIADRARLAGAPLPPVAREGVYVRPAPPWLARALTMRLGSSRVQPAGPLGVLVRGSWEGVGSVGLGFRPLPLGGLRPLLRLGGVPGEDPAAVEEALRALPAATVVFAGDVAPGYPDRLEETASAIRAAGLTLGVVETADQLGNLDQAGVRRIDQLLGGDTVRVFSLPPWVTAGESPADVVLTVLRAVEDRNIRVVYFHPVRGGIEANVAVIRDSAQRLRRAGFALAPAVPFPDLTVPRWSRAALGVGAAAAVLLLAARFLPVASRFWPAALLGAALPPVASSLLAALAFPSLGAVVLAGRWGRPPAPAFGTAWAAAVRDAAAAAGLALVGGVYVASVLADRAHMLEWAYFRGVKLSFLVPPLVAALAVGWPWGEPVRPKHLAALAVGLAAGLLYVVRSGNAPVAFGFAPEQKLRLVLEEWLTVRPRTKEFLVGYPAAFLVAFAAGRRERGLFLTGVLAGSVALVSVTNSFEHVRTPFVLSLVRTGYGWALGVGLGTLLLAALHALWRLAISRYSPS